MIRRFLSLSYLLLSPLTALTPLELASLPESWHSFILEEQIKHPDFFFSFHEILEQGSLILLQQGEGAAYLLLDRMISPRFIIKPTDEGISCINNPKQGADFLIKQEGRPHIPLYRSAQTEAFCYELSTLCQLDTITPPTFLTLVSHRKFYFSHTKLFSCLPQKLCSIQKYLQNTFSLRIVLENLLSLGLTEKQLAEHFDFEDFEHLSLFLWLIYDTDAHPDNFRVYPKQMHPDGLPIYGMKKIDNGLSFPEKNKEFSSFFLFFPHAEKPVSETIKQKIRALPMQKIESSLHRFCLSSSLVAWQERVFLLKQLIQKTDVTYYEIGLSLKKLEEL